MSARKDVALTKAADPFRRVLAINEPFNLAADRPLQSMLPGIWPTVGELRAFVSASAAAAAKIKADALTIKNLSSSLKSALGPPCGETE